MKKNKAVFEWYDQATYVMRIPKSLGTVVGFHKTKNKKKLFALCENGILEISRGES